MEKKIKVFIPSYNRADTICTHKLFLLDKELFDVKVVVHTEEQKQDYIKLNPELKDLMIVSNAKNGIAGQRDFIDSQLKVGEWYISADDDIESITSVIDKYYNLPEIPESIATKETYSKVLTPQELYDIFQEFIFNEEIHKSTLYGFATNDNIFFRRKKISQNSFIIGQIFLEKKLKDTPKSKVKIKEDYERTANHILLSGKTIRNNYLRPKTKMYSKGGVGNKESRQLDLKESSKILIDYYNGLFIQSTNKPEEKETEISMPIRQTKDIKNWRLKMILKGKLDKSYISKILPEKEAQQFISKYLK